MSDTKQKFRTHVSSFIVNVGPAAVRGALVSLQAPESKEGKAHFVAPNGNQVKQKYQDVVTGDLYDQADLSKAVGEVQVDREAFEEARKGVLVKDVSSWTVHPAKQANPKLYPSAHASYVFIPDEKDPTNKVWYDVLATAVADEDLTFISNCNIRNSEGLYRLVAWRGYVVVQRVLFPDGVNDHEPYEADVENPHVAKLVPMVKGLIESFDPESYRDTVAERIAAVVEAGEQGLPAPVVGKTAQPAVFDVDAAMAAFAAYSKKED